ncbi:MAG TPA: hypothetical protein VK506_01900 [Conexibacter sp.]|nr:hypothetical protein [Conexibacter sp.]
MARRFAPLLAFLAALAVGGCEYGTAADLSAAQERARVAFIEAHDDLSDRDLARLCPGLYPRDFLTDHDEWPAGELRDGESDARFTAEDRAAAEAASCDVRPD